MQTYARRQPAYQNRRAVYGQPSIEGPSIVFASPPLPVRPSGEITDDDAFFASLSGPPPDPARHPSTWTEHETVSVMNTAGQLIGTAGSTIQAIINGNNTAARDQLQSQTMIRLQELRSQAAAANEPALRLQLQQQADLLRTITNALENAQRVPAVPIPPPVQQQQQGMSQNMKIGIGVAALAAVAGIAYVATRKNPTESPNDNPSVLVYGQKRFISAREFEKLRRRLAQRHAA